RDPTRPLLRRPVDVVERDKLRQPLRRLNLRDRRRQRRLPMVDVPDRPHVHVRLRPLKLSLGHVSFLPLSRYPFSARPFAAPADFPLPAPRTPVIPAPRPAHRIGWRIADNGYRSYPRTFA